MGDDPFDRILVCQAIVGGMSSVTPDDDVGRPMAKTDARGVFSLPDIGVGEVSRA